MLTVSRGAALYVGALVGPGLLLVPSLAAQAAGPVSILAWAALLLLSAPLAIAFAGLGVQHPVAGGVSAYVRAAFGDLAATITGAWFLAAVIIGGPAVALIGGYYVADLAGSGTGTSGRAIAVLVGLAMQGTVLAANAIGLRLSSGFQLALSAVLVAVVGVAVAVALPPRATHNWTPFAPHGWWAAGTAANILIWLFIGWEAMAQLAGEFRRPARDLPRAIGLAYAVIAVLYAGLAVATITVTAGAPSRIPLADLIGVGFGRPGVEATAVLAAALTMGTMNVYTAGAAKLAAAVAPSTWLAGDSHRGVPRRPLLVLAITGTGLLVALGTGAIGPDDVVRATSACFIAVYVLALASAVRLLRAGTRVAAIVALPLVCVVAAFSSAYLLVPAVVALAVLATALGRRRRRQVPSRLPASQRY
ncbi:MAG: amino acid permease [Micromonosporaceae bacterium]|nr:amino acid permease [Micromonosporaceae bacterium]